MMMFVFWTFMAGLGHCIAAASVRDFIRTHGTNPYVMIGTARREGKFLALFIFAVLFLWLSGVASNHAEANGGFGAIGGLFVGVFLIYGPVAAATMGEACVLWHLNRRIAESTARELYRAGYREPLMLDRTAANAAAQLTYGGEQSPEPVAQINNIVVRHAPQDEAAFAFDPTKFKR